MTHGVNKNEDTTPVSRMAATWTVGLIAFLLAALALPSTTLGATVTNQRPFLFSFDGSGSSIGALTTPVKIDIEEATGDVYVTNQAGAGQGPGPPFDQQRVVCKFDAEGKALDFPGSGKSCFDGDEAMGVPFGVEGFFGRGASLSGLAIDNSAVNPGRIYLSEEGGPIYAFAPDGTHIWTMSQTEAQPCGIAVDREGHLWVGNGYEGVAPTKILEFAATGSPPEQIGEFPLKRGNGCPVGVSADGKTIYVALDGGGIDKYHEGAFGSTLSEKSPFDVKVNQSSATGHIFTADSTSFSEYEPCVGLTCKPSLAAGSPFGGDLISNTRGIAHNPDPAKDWIYVADRDAGRVKVFGPKASGTAPDVSCQATDEIDLRTASAHCTINPLGLKNAYHFEWRRCGNDSCTVGDTTWGTALSSAPQSIEPSDSNPHQVSIALDELRSNSRYEVRLVGTKTENGLNSLNAYSSPDSFRTKIPPPPKVKCKPVTGITTESAHLTCTIETFEEETTWRAQKSTDPECKSGFVDEPLQTIPEGEAGGVEVQWDLEGLLAAQRYCVRVIATGPGPGQGEDEQKFITGAIPPSGASLAFTAPRTDTTARINARINPEGEADLSYRFEWSEDGTLWVKLPIRVSSTDAREPILVADELGGLQPGTTYHYRLALAENEIGAVPSLGGERTFTTRSTAEVSSPEPCPNQDVRDAQHSAGYLGNCRGIELVNSPDKGNQNAVATSPQDTSPMSADGNEVLWQVTGGAPGAPNGTQSTFLAERGEGEAGWKSQSIVPPVEKQHNGGDDAYTLLAATPDFETFVLNVVRSVVVAQPEPLTLVRVHRGQPEEEILKAYTVQPVNTGYEGLIDRSDDGKAVFFIDNTKVPYQLEDIGTSPHEPISLMPGGSATQCGLSLEAGGFGNSLPGYHWVATEDGSRVYFEVSADGNCSGSKGIYVRDREAQETTLVSSAAQFIRTTPDGHQAFFRTAEACRRFAQSNPFGCEAPEPADTNKHPDVYLWDEASGESSCLTCVLADADVEERVLVSDDFSHVYFESSKKLIAGEGKAGSANIYVLRGGQIGFVGTASLGFFPQLSADGNELLFRADALPSLSADALAPKCIEAHSQKAVECTQLYLYEDGEESLECLSCRHGAITTHSIGAPGSSQFDLRLSADGTTAAFATQQALLEKDVNNDTDIYEWRTGATHLITDGVSDFQVEVAAPKVLAVNEDGSDILFGLVAPSGSLTGYEQDRLLNLYDARIGGGFPPPSPQTHCHEDSCQGPLQPPPAQAQPASAGFGGRGNVPPPHKPRPCARKRGKKIKHSCRQRHSKREAGHGHKGGAK
jgi:DNA-binding beta-propeller fold protein YncE